MALTLCAIGIVVIICPFVPSWSYNPSTHQFDTHSIGESLAMMLAGLVFLAVGLAYGWFTLKWTIRVDDEGIFQTNGFTTQTVRWADVASYYLRPKHYSNKNRALFQPVLLAAAGSVLLWGFAQPPGSNKSMTERKRELLPFVQARLEGKEIEEPTPDSWTLALRSSEFDWAKMSQGWKVRRVLLFLGFILVWTAGIALLTLFFPVPPKSPEGAIYTLVSIIGIKLTQFVWLKRKQRQIEKERKNREIGHP